MPKRSNIDYMLIKERTGFTIKNSILEIRPRLGFVWNSLPQKVYAVSTERKLKSKFRWNFSVLECHFPCDNNSFKLARTPARCAGRSCKSDRRLWIRCQDEFGIWPFCNSSEKVEDNEPCIYRNKIVFFTHRGCIAIIGAVGLANGKRSWESEH